MGRTQQSLPPRSPQPRGGNRSRLPHQWLKRFHADTARYINRLDGVMGRQLWHNFRETHLTHQRSYLARLTYTHNNPVHHRLVPRASDYEWCSERAFEQVVSPAWSKTIHSFHFTEIAAHDEDT